MNTRRMTALLLTIIMLTMVLGTGLSETEKITQYQSGDYFYTKDEEDNVTIFSWHGKDKTLIIPDQLDGYPVTAIGEQAFSSELVTEVVVPEGVTRIHQHAFSSNYLLTKVTLPGSLTPIDRSAFSFCKKLTDINLPEGLIALGEMAFSGCDVLEDIRLPDSLREIAGNPFINVSNIKISLSEEHPVFSLVDGVLFDHVNKTLVVYPKASPASAYTVPEGTRAIGNSAFRGSTNLERLILPDSLEHLGDQSISFCSNLRSITLPDNLMSMGANPFWGAKELYVSVRPDHPVFEVIDEVLFNHQTKTLIYYPSILKAREYTVPEGTQVIGAYAFYKAARLRHIALPDGLTTIEQGAFSDCTGLGDLTIPDSVTSMMDSIFSNRSSRLRLLVTPGSLAEEYAKKNRIDYAENDTT